MHYLKAHQKLFQQLHKDLLKSQISLKSTALFGICLEKYLKRIQLGSNSYEIQHMLITYSWSYLPFHCWTKTTLSNKENSNQLKRKLH